MPTWRIYTFIVVIVGMALAFGYLRLNGSATPLLKDENTLVIERTVVTDAAILRQTNPSFYKEAVDGDWVLRYGTHLDLYRPTEARVIQSIAVVK